MAQPQSTRAARVPKQVRSQMTRQRLLDAALDFLVEQGYSGMTTASVSARAGVSRGAQQHHFPQKATLVVEAVNYLGERQVERILRGGAAIRNTEARIEGVLDLLWRSYTGKLFLAWIELWLAARTDEELAEHLRRRELLIDRVINELVTEAFGPEIASDPGFRNWSQMALAAIRGLAIVKVTGRDDASVGRQWLAIRALLVDSGSMFLKPAPAPADAGPEAAVAR